MGIYIYSMGQLHFECLPLMLSSFCCFCFSPPLVLLYLSARTKEAKTLSSLSSKAWGVSYSRMIPRFITITRSAFRMVWTRCCGGGRGGRNPSLHRAARQKRCTFKTNALLPLDLIQLYFKKGRISLLNIYVL